MHNKECIKGAELLWMKLRPLKGKEPGIFYSEDLKQKIFVYKKYIVKNFWYRGLLKDWKYHYPKWSKAQNIFLLK